MVNRNGERIDGRKGEEEEPPWCFFFCASAFLRKKKQRSLSPCEANGLGPCEKGNEGRKEKHIELSPIGLKQRCRLHIGEKQFIDTMLENFG